MFKINTETISSTVIKYWPCLLVLLAFIGFISKALYNYPIGIMALLGLYKIMSMPGILVKDQILKLFTLVFLCLWLPLSISFPDAVNPGHAAHTIFPYLRFYFAGIFIIQKISRDSDRLKFIVVGVFFIVIFWSIDATIQFVFNQNLLGFPYDAGHITGMFYPRNTISHICSILSVFCFLVICQNAHKYKWLWLTLIPLFFVILVSGKRAAWVMLALSSFGFFIYLYLCADNKKQILKLTGIITLSISIVLGSTIVLHKPTNERFKDTLGLFSNDYRTIDIATAHRLPIWETAYSIFKDNPINGIGPRGFRHVYLDYSSPDNFFFKRGRSQTHPHLLILEILTETGLVGLFCYFILFYIILNLLFISTQRIKLYPFLIPVLVSLFPFNAHMAFYGSIWSSMIWLLLTLYFSKTRLIMKYD